MTQAYNDLLVGPVQPANGTTLISIDFHFESESDLEIYKGGSSTALTFGVDYTVSLPSSYGATDGSITLLTAANGVDTYAIYGRQPLERTSDFQFRGAFRSPVLNRELDRLWRAVQGINTSVLRSLRFSEASVSADSLETLTALGRAGKVIGFSEDGAELVVKSEFEGITVPTASRDNAIARWGGTVAGELQASLVLIDDTGRIKIIDDEALTGTVDLYRAAAVAYLDVDPDNEDANSEWITRIDGAQVFRIDSNGAVLGLGEADRTLRLSGTDAIKIPVGTTAQRPGSPEQGDIRRNSQVGQWEGYDGSGWGSLGGAGLFRGNNGTSGDGVNGSGDIFRVNAATLTVNEEIESGENASAAGPLTVGSGVTLTVTGNLVIV